MNNRAHLFRPANAHILMVSFLLGAVGALLIGLKQSLKTAEASIRPNLKVVVFVSPQLSEDQARKWAATLTTADPEMESATFISRDEALSRAQENPALAKSLILLRDNPFPATIVLLYKDSAWLGRPEPALLLKSMPEAQEIRWDPEARSVFRSLRQWRAWILRVSAFAVMMLGVWCLFGIYRFFAMKSPYSELGIQLGIGLVGGSLAMATWGLALRGIGQDAALYRPEAISLWPLVTALMAALATFGWEVDHEE